MISGLFCLLWLIDGKNVEYILQKEGLYMFRIEAEKIDMNKTADSGQIFRFNRIGEDKFELIASDKLLYIKEIKNDAGSLSHYEISCTEYEYNNYWENYFDLKTDYSAFIKDIPKDDIFLNKAVSYSNGIHILNQDKWEMLISFIISQRKSISAIKTSIEKLCCMFGKQIADGRYAFPTPEALACANLYELNACSLGYRSEYIYEAASLIASGKIVLDKLDKLNDKELIESLMRFKGVGIKVANCVFLFAYHRIGAFPVDVWIDRVIKTYYNGSFPINRYKGYAGVIQQYIFFYARNKDRNI